MSIELRSVLRSTQRAGALFVLGASMAACAGVMQSTEQLVGAHDRCASALGAYSLPKTTLRVKVTQVTAGDRPRLYILEEIVPIRRADERFTFCLDYLANAFADDDVQVKRSRKKKVKSFVDGKPVEKIEDAATPFLQLITSKAVDTSAIAIRKLIRAIFIGLSNNPNFSDARTLLLDKTAQVVMVADFEFDPLDPAEMAGVNERLRHFGFCVVMGDFTYDRRRVPPGDYCSSPGQVALHNPSIAARVVAEAEQTIKADVPGVHYRPRAPFSLSVYAKEDPDGPGAWRLAKRETVFLENISPIIALGVDRAMFAARRTALVFDDGVLVQVCIAKGSEALGAIQIPLDVVYGLVALPSQIVQVQIDSANNNAEVIGTETMVIQAQQKLIDYKTKGGDLPNELASAGKFRPLQLEDLTLEPEKAGSIAKEFDDQKPDIDEISAASNPLADICRGLGEKNENPALTLNPTVGHQSAIGGQI